MQALIYFFLLGAGLLFGLSGWLCWSALQDYRAAKQALKQRLVTYEQGTRHHTALTARL
jgi:hypothetical protein